MSNTDNLSIDENVICDLDFLGVIKINGEDAQAFLQGQFSNDVNALESNQCQISSYNSPKGRMYASFYLARTDNDYLMIVPKELIAMLIKRLRMFVMRSKVELQDLSENLKCTGLKGDKALSLLAEKIEVPAEPMMATNSDGITCARIDSERAICLTSKPHEFDAISASLSSAGSEHWRRLDIHAGIPNIFSSTQEEFVAQMVNLQLVDGVSFTKGCYPGQEVVARMHYLGKLKKRMFRVTVQCAEAPTPGDKIFVAGSDENAQSVGQVVDAIANEKGTVDALAVLQIKSAEESPLEVRSPQQAAISIESLPYALSESA